MGLWEQVQGQRDLQAGHGGGSGRWGGDRLRRVSQRRLWECRLPGSVGALLPAGGAVFLVRPVASDAPGL